MQENRPLVLVVDDSPVNLQQAIAILKNDYRVKVANNGSSGLELAIHSPPDLILLDIMMPGMDGYEVCRHLKANPNTRHIPVIFLTSKTEEEDEKMGFLVGAADFIHKPFSPPLMALRVKTQLEIKFIHDLLRSDSELERAQRSELMRIFSRHVSDEVAEEMWRARAEFQNDSRPRPVELSATVLFSDIRGFTSISEKLEPQVLFDWLNLYMEEMAKVVAEHRGMVNKYIGDSIMAVFGTPIPRTTEEEIKQDAVRAADCALAMGEALKVLNEEFKQRGWPTIEIRIGINTGPLTAGTLGSAQRLEYTVIGDTVNSAARLEQLCDVGDSNTPDSSCRLLIGEPTARRLGAQHKIKAMSIQLLKGKTEEISVFLLEGRLIN
jgi:class 3 adenylate cyclase